MVRSMMSQTTLPKSFWDYALETAARIRRYPKEIIGYSFYYPPEKKVFIARNAKFFENSLITQEAGGSLEDLEIIQEEDTHPFKNTSSHHDEDNQEIDEPQKYELGDLNEPANYKAALSDPGFDKWLKAMNVEMQSMKDNEVWNLVDLPPNDEVACNLRIISSYKESDIDPDALPPAASFQIWSFLRVEFCWLDEVSFQA
ncbi:retrotransposon protein, putative, ty1-copia subclass [Tanacetum coccineum]